MHLRQARFLPPFLSCRNMLSEELAWGPPRRRCGVLCVRAGVVISRVSWIHSSPATSLDVIYGCLNDPRHLSFASTARIGFTSEERRGGGGHSGGGGVVVWHRQSRVRCEGTVKGEDGGKGAEIGKDAEGRRRKSRLGRWAEEEGSEIETD